MRYIVIPIFDYTTDDEVSDIMQCLVDIGIDDARVEIDSDCAVKIA